MSKTRKIRRARNARDRALKVARSNATLAHLYKQRYDRLSKELDEAKAEHKSTNGVTRWISDNFSFGGWK